MFAFGLYLSRPSSAPLITHSLPPQCLLTVEHYYYISITAYNVYICDVLPTISPLAYIFKDGFVQRRYRLYIILSLKRIGTTNNIFLMDLNMGIYVRKMCNSVVSYSYIYMYIYMFV